MDTHIHKHARVQRKKLSKSIFISSNFPPLLSKNIEKITRILIP